MTDARQGGTVLHAVPVAGGRVRGLVRFDDGRLSIAETKGQSAEDVAAGAQALFAPASLERLVLFASATLRGHPDAINHPKALLMLASAVVALALPDENYHIDGIGKGKP